MTTATAAQWIDRSKTGRSPHPGGPDGPVPDVPPAIPEPVPEPPVPAPEPWPVPEPEPVPSPTPDPSAPPGEPGVSDRAGSSSP